MKPKSKTRNLFFCPLWPPLRGFFVNFLIIANSWIVQNIYFREIYKILPIRFLALPNKNGCHLFTKRGPCKAKILLLAQNLENDVISIQVVTWQMNSNSPNQNDFFFFVKNRFLWNYTIESWDEHFELSFDSFWVCLTKFDFVRRFKVKSHFDS